MKVGKVRQFLGRLVLVALAAIFPAVAAAQDQFVLHTPAAAVGTVASRYGLQVLSQVPNEDIFLVQGPAGADPQTLVAQVSADANVAEFEQNEDVVLPESLQGVQLNQSTSAILDLLSNRTVVPYFGSTVWSSYANQPAAILVRTADAQRLLASLFPSSSPTAGAGIVAVIDTGVAPDHPALSGSLVPGYDFTRNLAGSASEWLDLNQSTSAILDQSTSAILDFSSTTVVLNQVLLNQSTSAILDQSTSAILDTTKVPPAFGHGTMVAGIVHLVAPSAKIMPLKAFKADGTSKLFDVLRAIYFAVQNGARVINMSFSLAASSQEFARAISLATENRVICVASAGNSGKEVLVYPAALRNSISIASTNNQDVRSTFSNFGASLVSVAAPGEGIITSYPGGFYAAAWGTSFSAPFASGGAALLLQIDSGTNQDKAEQALSHAAKIGQDLGAGRIDLYQALLSRIKN